MPPGLPLPASARPARRVARAWRLAMLLGIGMLAGPAWAGQSDRAVQQDYDKGQFRAAAERGLAVLLDEPWNHALRLLVADSLAKAGDPAGAAVQLDALEGTQLAQAAAKRRRALGPAALAPARSAPAVTASPAATAVAVTPVLSPAAAAVPVAIMPTAQTPVPTMAVAAAPLAAPSAPAAPPAAPPALAKPLAAMPMASPDQPAPPAALPAATPAASPGTAGPLAASAPAGTSIEVGRVAQFSYIPDGAASTAAVPDAQSSPAAREIAALSAAGNYQKVASLGLALPSTQRNDPVTQLQIANALAWTGRLEPALEAYQGLLDGQLDKEARVGAANVQRWRGRDAQAALLYQEVLAKHPGDAGATEGLALARRELRPRSTLSLGAQEDSGGMQRRSAGLNQRWRHGAQAHLVELDIGRVDDSLASDAQSQSELSVRYHAHSLPMSPTVEVGTANGGAGLFGTVRVQPGAGTALEFGRVNWARMAANPKALSQELSATMVGAEFGRNIALGQIKGRLQHFNVSDGNQVSTASLSLVSPWRPLGKYFKPFAGIEVRDAGFNTPAYWSPEIGSGVLYAGLQAEAGASDWNVYASANAGTRLYGDAGTSWSLALGGKRWLSSDVALSFNLWRMSSQRDNAAYRARSGSVSVEKLW